MPKQKKEMILPGVSAETLQGIRDFCLMDDVYFTAFFDHFKEGMALTLSIILNKPDLKVWSVVPQYTIGNLYGRGVRFDVWAKDTDGHLYDCEVQRASSGAVSRRARYNSSMLDAQEVAKGAKFYQLPETYVIFITEKDVFKKHLPLYEFERICKQTGEPFDDGAHILYVNGECRDDTDLGKLMQDFFARKPEDMHYRILREQAHFLKDEAKGVGQMNEILQKLMDERIEAAEQAANERTAMRFLKMGLSPEDVAKGTGLTLEEVKELIREKTA